MLQNWCECPEVSTLYSCVSSSFLSVVCAQVGRRRSHMRSSLSSGARRRSASSSEQVQPVPVLRGCSRLFVLRLSQS